MRHVKFTMVSNREMGGEGIVPNIFKNWSNYMPTGDFGIGHDLIEHSTKENGFVWQELVAFGAILYVRNWGIYIRNNGIFKGDAITEQAKALAWEMPNVFRDSETEIEFPEMPKYKLTREEKQKLRYFMHTFRTEANKAFDSEEETELDAETFDKIENVIGYGFAKAKKRYSQHDVYNVFHMKELIQNEVKRRWNTLCEYTDSGVEFTLSYDIANGHCEIRHNWIF